MQTNKFKKYIYKWNKRLKILKKTGIEIIIGNSNFTAYTPCFWISVISLLILIEELVGIRYSTDIILFSIILFIFLCIIAVIDIQYLIIAEAPLFILFITSFLFIIYHNQDHLEYHIFASVFGFLFIRLISLFYMYFRNMEAIGDGDAKLYAFAGFCLGPNGITSCMIISVISAIFSSIIALRTNNLKSINEPIPFGPHLALGIWLVWVYGPLDIN